MSGQDLSVFLDRNPAAVEIRLHITANISVLLILGSMEIRRNEVG